MKLAKTNIIHGALLAVALGFAWQTLTRKVAPDRPPGSVTLWGGSPAEIVSVHYESELPTESRAIDVVRKDGYLWGVSKRTTKPPKPPVPPVPPPPAPGTPDAGTPAPAPEPPKQVEPVVTTREFTVGEAGTKLLEKLVPLVALRDLGKLDEARKKEYGLDAPKGKLVVKRAGASHELIVGGNVFGGGDRYVLERSSGRVFVVADDAIRPLDTGEVTLPERKLHAFEPADIAEVLVQGGGKERRVLRKTEPGKPKPIWSDAATPAVEDQTLAAFMDRVSPLAPLDYPSPAPTDAELTLVLKFTYRSAKSAELGTTELYKKPALKEGTFDWYVKSERTRVVARVSAPVAERLEQDLASL